MSVGAILRNRIYRQENEKAAMQKISDKYSSAYKKSAKRRDTVEISSEAYELQSEETEMTATSGKDVLGITKGGKENTFIIRFSDSAMISRAVSRGYITVNGRDVLLSDEIKAQLMKVDKQAQTDRERAFGEYVLQYNCLVYKQQSEALENEAKRMAQAMAIAARMASGGKVSAEDEEFLMKYNPEMYAVAKSASIMTEQQERQKESKISNDEAASGNASGETGEGDTWSKCDWKSYETNMTVSMGKTPEIQEIAENEIILNTGSLS